MGIFLSVTSFTAIVFLCIAIYAYAKTENKEDKSPTWTEIESRRLNK
jgi:hypothetical protein